MNSHFAVAAVAALVVASPAWAADNKSQNDTPPQLARLLACRSVADAEQRLACFDRETAATSEALARNDLVAMDRAKVRETRRSVFGFSVPKLGIFGGGDTDEVDQIDGTIAKVGWTRDGVSVRLQDQSQWVQTDGKTLPIEPRAGNKVIIKRGALGSYIMNIAGQRGVKVKRVG